MGKVACGEVGIVKRFNSTIGYGTYFQCKMLTLTAMLMKISQRTPGIGNFNLAYFEKILAHFVVKKRICNFF